MNPRPARFRIAWSDGPDEWMRLPLPARSVWPAAMLTGGLCVAFALPWIGDIRNLLEHDSSTIGDLIRMLLEGFGIFIWSLLVLLLFLGTLALALHRDEIRASAHKLAYVARYGPLRLFTEYELTRISSVRTGSAAPPGLTNICLEYDGVTAPFGRALPAAVLAHALEFIRAARASGTADIEVTVGGRAPGTRPETVDVRWPWLAPAFLVGANLVPLVGVLLFDWDLTQIMLLFWAENAVVGFYALLKLAVIQRWGVLLLGPLFLGHYGAFMAVHLWFVYHLFVRGLDTRQPEWHASTVLAAQFAPLWTALLAMFVSHGVSFFGNFVARQEYVGRTGLRQMVDPYRRVLLLHFTLILGGLAVLALGEPVYALVVLVGVKITVDLHAHLRERGPARPMPWDEPPPEWKRPPVP